MKRITTENLFPHFAPEENYYCNTIIDGALQFTGTAGTISTDAPTTGTQTSTNVLDLLNARDLGVGDDSALKILYEVIVAFASGTSLQIVIQGAPDNGSGSPGSYTTYASGPVIAEANLTVGARLCDIDLPRKAMGAALPRFLRAQYVTVGTHTAGTVFGSIVLDRQDDVYYPPGIVIAN
jgi:hypothetical protein